MKNYPLILLLLCSPLLPAAEIIVTNTADSGPGSLRQAAADAVLGDTVTFDPALDGQTITLTSGVILLTQAVSFDASALANGLTVSGNDSSRIFRIIGVVPPAPPTAPAAVQSSSFGFPASNAVDGDINTFTHTDIVTDPMPLCASPTVAISSSTG